MHIIEPVPVENPLVNYIVLGLSFLFEGSSWMVALREFRRSKGKLGYIQAVRLSKDPSVYTVLFEDSAALAGLVIAFFGILGAQLLEVPELDGAASIGISLVLGATAAFLARESKGLLIGERALPEVEAAVLAIAQGDPDVTVIAGGTYDDSEGWFIRPTVLECADPTAEYFTDEYFGPVLAVHVYDDDRYDEVLAQMESVASYALTGSIIAQDREAVAHAMHGLRFAAGNVYISDKSTGAVVGQQPFGGARASGTNDKAGSPANLMRWTSPRSIKETFAPPTDYRYPYMG